MDGDSRAELLAQDSLGKRAEEIKTELRGTRVVIGLPRHIAQTRLGQIGLVTATNILCRLGGLAPNLYLDVPAEVPVLANVPLLDTGEPLAESVSAMTTRLAAIQRGVGTREIAVPNTTYDHGLFIGSPTANASHPIVVGSNRWLATVRPDGKQECTNTADQNPLGMVLAAALGAAEVVKRMWLPIRSSSVVIEPITRRTTVSAYDLSVNAHRPLNPDIPPATVLDGHACLFGLGAVGSACLFVLACMPHLNVSLDLVDMDRIEPSNEERLFTSSRPAHDVGKGKVIHAQQFIRSVHGSAQAFAYAVRFEQFVERARDRLGYVMCGLDSTAARRALQLELPSVIANGGTEASRWTVSLHEHDRPEAACLLDLYPKPKGKPFDPIRELAERLGISVELIRQWAHSGKPLQAVVPGVGTAAVKDPGKRRAQLGMKNVRYAQAVAHVCSTMKPAQAAPAATISFVSLLPGIAMVSDFVKRRLYGWRPSPRHPNYFQFDALRDPARSRALNISAGADCFCQQEQYREAFDKRQDLRRSHLDSTFSSPAAVAQPVPRRPLGVRRQPNVGRRPVPARRPRRAPGRHLLPGPGPPPPAQRPALPGPIAKLRLVEAVLLWLLAICVYASSLVVTALLLGLFVRAESDVESVWQFWRLFGMACRTRLDSVHWVKFFGVSFVPLVVYALAAPVTARVLVEGMALYRRATGRPAHRNANDVTKTLSNALGWIAAPGLWLGMLTASAVVVRSIARLFGRTHGCLALFALYVAIPLFAGLLLGVPAFTIGLALVACKKLLARVRR